MGAHRKYSDSEMYLAMKLTNDPARAAGLLGCSSRTIQRFLHRHARDARAAAIAHRLRQLELSRKPKHPAPDGVVR